MPSKTYQATPRERILDKAEELFYAQGYHATGINQIIDESGVAKATFYVHFPSKEELCVAYLKRISAHESKLVRAELEKRKSALSRYLSVLEVLEPWLVETKFRGCPFLNIASEVCDEKSPIRKVGLDFYREHSHLVEQCVKDLKASDPRKYAHLDSAAVAKNYMTIFVGVIGLCEIFHSIEPIKDGLRLVKELVK